MNQADREFSLINSIVGCSVAGDTQRSNYAGKRRPSASHPGAGALPAQNACFRETLQPPAITAPLLPYPKGSSLAPLQSTIDL